jgi:hypothetical protein
MKRKMTRLDAVPSTEYIVPNDTVIDKTRRSSVAAGGIAHFYAPARKNASAAQDAPTKVSPVMKVQKSHLKIAVIYKKKRDSPMCDCPHN